MVASIGWTFFRQRWRPATVLCWSVPGGGRQARQRRRRCAVPGAALRRFITEGFDAFLECGILAAHPARRNAARGHGAPASVRRHRRLQPARGGAGPGGAPAQDTVARWDHAPGHEPAGVHAAAGRAGAAAAAALDPSSWRAGPQRQAARAWSSTSTCTTVRTAAPGSSISSSPSSSAR